jgi:hypothetical protein
MNKINGNIHLIISFAVIILSFAINLMAFISPSQLDASMKVMILMFFNTGFLFALWHVISISLRDKKEKVESDATKQ